jgi:iron complex transport system substrate-binding protein
MYRKLLLLFLLLQFIASYKCGFAKTAKYISLAPSTTEILFALGLKNEIAAISSFCNYPSETKNKSKVGTFSNPDIERIVTLNPDIVFATGLEQIVAIDRLKSLSIEIFVSDPSNIKELFNSIIDIGKLTDKEREAKKLIKKMGESIKNISKKVKSIPLKERPKVFIEIWHDPLLTAGNGSFIDELIYMAGGINIAHDVPRPYSQISSEQVVSSNPDFVIMGHKDAKIADSIRMRLGWSNINAVKNNCIYADIDPDLFLRPGPRIIQGLENIHKRLYSNEAKFKK